MNETAPAQVVLLAEDDAQERFVGSLIDRLAKDEAKPIRLRTISAFGGMPKVLRELQRLERSVATAAAAPPAIVVVALDANCKGIASRRRLIEERAGCLLGHVVAAISDPHIERWFLIDGAAFRKVFGRGCAAPDQKCEKDRYKSLLRDAIRATGFDPLLGGVEFAKDLVEAFEFQRAGSADDAFAEFVASLRRALRSLP